MEIDPVGHRHGGAPAGEEVVVGGVGALGRADRRRELGPAGATGATKLPAEVEVEQGGALDAEIAELLLKNKVEWKRAEGGDSQ